MLALLPGMRERRFGTNVNLSSVGVLARTPRFGAYVASKAALDVLCDTYQQFPVLTPDQAADVLCEAIIHRPRRVSPPFGQLAAFADAVSPAVMDRVRNQGYQLFDDSAAAHGERPGHEPQELDGRAQAFANLTAARTGSRNARRVAATVTVSYTTIKDAVVQQDDWSKLFWAAFRESRNPMVLLDAERKIVDANGAFLRLVGYTAEELISQPSHRFVIGGSVLSSEAWAQNLAVGHFTGETELRRADGGTVFVQWGAQAEVVTGHQLVLLVALSTSRWGRHFRRAMPQAPPAAHLTEREREVVRLVAEGWTGPEIADELHISHDTARSHVRNAMTKLGTRSRAQLVARALGLGIV